MFSCQSDGEHSPWALPRAGPEKVYGVQVVGLRGPFSAELGSRAGLGVWSLRCLKGPQDLGSDLKVINEWWGANPMCVPEHLQTKVTLEPRTKP